MQIHNVLPPIGVLPAHARMRGSGHRRRAASLSIPPAPEPRMARPLDALIAQVSEVILGKDVAIRQSVTCLLAGGHLLIEDLPGVGKTTLAHALAVSLGLRFSRVQFTSDLLPSDIVGVSVYERPDQRLAGEGTQGGRFVFHPGPIFSEILLADEVNRATPKTQSALLEAMEERQVSIEGATRALPEPFFVIATQNPFHQIGTFPLPESQLDRFMMCIALGYPDVRAERALLEGEDRRLLMKKLDRVLDAASLNALQSEVRAVHVSSALLDYVQALVGATRRAAAFAEGLSPRGALALLQAARAWALLSRRDHVLPEDVQAVWVSVVNHRLRPLTTSGASHVAQRDAALQLLATVPLAG
jgi:MoxR-like ATPase